MKKLLSLLLVSVFVASCTLGGASDDTTKESVDTTGPNGQTEVTVSAGDFNSLYWAYITAQINEIKSTFNIAGIFDPQKSTGNLALSAQASMLGSVNASADIMAHGNGTTSKVIFSNINFSLASMLAGNIEAKIEEVGLIQSLTQNFVSFKGLDLPEPYASQVATFSDFEGKWIQLPTADTQNTEMLKQLLSLTQEEINDFITKYPVLKAKWEATIDGTKNTFDVEFDADNIISLRKALSERLGGEDEFDEEAYKTALEEVNNNFNATLTFDTENHLYLDAKLAFLEDGETVGNIIIQSDKNTCFVEVTPTQEEGKVTIEIKENDAGNTTVDMTTELNEEIIKMQIEVGMSDAMLTLFKMTLENSDFKMNADYEYKNNAFNGSIHSSADEDSIAMTFDGTTKESVVQTFNFELTAPDDVKITAQTKDPTDDMMSGTFSLEAGEQGKITGNLGLALGKEVFGLSLDGIKIETGEDEDIAQVQQMIDGFTFSFLVRGTSEKTDEEVQMPTDFVSYEEIMNAVMSDNSNDDDYDDSLWMESDDDSVMIDGSDISVQSADGNITLDDGNTSAQSEDWTKIDVDINAKQGITIGQ